ncbi:hypothetical protein P8452_22940 [Trifolium repens]|nr:hypothetical protein P8452_22940 [Trifolium repens]
MNFLHESSTYQTNNVSITMAEHLFSKNSNKNNNIVFSPLSIQVILGIIAAGSEGRTQQQLLDFLLFQSIDNLNSYSSQLVSVILKDGAPAGGPRLSFTNGVWVEKSLSLQPSFKQIVSSDYEATLASVDFITKAVKVIKEVNMWVEKGTNGLIKEILSPDSVNSLTRLIFANALYFKGTWKEMFDALKTKRYKFHPLNGKSVQVPFMTSKKQQFIRVFDDFKVLRLPYKQGNDKRQFSMYIFLPNVKKGLRTLVKKVASNSELLNCQLPFKKVKVGDFRIPKFKFSFGFETPDMLKKLGVVLPFSHGGLTKIVDSPTGKLLYVSNIFHKSFIEVNEKGTEAAAATATVMLKGKSISPGIDFVADHPFLFLIREDSSGTILFMGQMLNPLVE